MVLKKQRMMRKISSFKRKSQIKVEIEMKNDKYYTYSKNTFDLTLM